MKNGLNNIKTTQKLIVQMFKTKKSNQYSNNSNSKRIQPNNNINMNYNQKYNQNIFGNINIKGGKLYINPQNNLTNRGKYKTTKNSPEKLLIQRNLSRQKNVKGINNSHRQNNKMQINNSLNNINKIILLNQKNNNILKDEIIKKKILQIKEKKNITTINSNNNSMSLSNSINQNYNYNYNHKHNNSNYNLGYFQDKNKIKGFINNENDNLQNKIKSNLIQQPYSYREIKRRSNSNYELEHNINNKGQFINNSKKGKYYNLINKYIASAAASSKQPKRQNNQRSFKNKFNTITAKKATDIYKQKQNNKNTLSCRGVRTNFIEKVNNIGYINKIKNNFPNHNIKNNNFFFSTTSNNLYKPKQQSKQIPNFHFINKTSYPSKQTSRKHSLEKSGQNSMNHSSINHLINSGSSNYLIKNYNSPAITLNNHRKSEILNKKMNLNNGNNNFNNNIYDYANNKINIANGINNNKYRFNGVYSNSNSKEYSKDNNIKKNNLSNITDFKKYNVEKIINQLYKHKDNFNNIKFQKINKNEIKNKFTNIKKDQENEQEKHYIINDNKKNNDNSKLFYSKEIKENKEIIGNIINKDNKIRENIINNNLNINGDNTTQKDKKQCNNIINNINPNKENKENKYNKDLPSNTSINKNNNKENNNDNDYNFKNIIDKSLDNLENKKNNIKNKEKTKKSIDKDLSCSENDNDSLLEYVNNNVDYVPDNINNLNNTDISESNDSMMSTLKENGKFTCYNRDMEIISNYIKNYYKKNKKYPSTKMKFYKYGRLLGKGAFGKVNLALHILTGRLVAIKSINKEKITTERQKQKIKLEINIMKKLSKSNNIVKIFETYETKKHICIVMEYICAGDLLSYIKKRSKLHEPVAKFIFKQIILALKFIHDNNIVHRDIKLDNILIDLDNNIKICDFGVSKIINKDDIMLEQCGTPAYIAPEILLNQGYDGFGVDVWSSGVVLYAMLSGCVPFKAPNLKDLHNLIISGNYQEIKDISQDASNLLKNILEIDPKKRYTTENILNHPWLSDVDINFWKNQNLFTIAEHVILAKSNVDYRNIANKDDMIENFNIKNLNTIDENISKNVNTKSFILAPFNTSISENDNNNNSINNDLLFNIMNNKSIKKIKEITDFNNPDLKILNGAIKYVSKVKDINRDYELNNNQEIDNGVVIKSKDSDDKNKKDNEISPLNGSYNNIIHNKVVIPTNEFEEINNENNIKKENEINEKALDILENLGYNKSYVKECFNKNIFNYATASYRLIVKYFFL